LIGFKDKRILNETGFQLKAPTIGASPKNGSNPEKTQKTSISKRELFLASLNIIILKINYLIIKSNQPFNIF